MKREIPFKKIGITSLIILSLILAVATIVENCKGTAFATTYIYSSWYFVALWFIFAICLLGYILQKKVYKKPILFLLALSLLLMLSGAFITFTTAKQGVLHLRMNEPANSFINKKDNVRQSLPFDILLTDFQIVYYPGTQAPSNYVSYIKIKKNGEEFEGEISMNKIFSKDGYRFYQSGYDRDRQGTILMVKSDRLGRPIVYCGYALFIIGMIGFLFSKNTGFRKLLNHPALKKSVITFFAFMMMSGAMAEERTLPKETSRKFGEIQMLYQNRIVPLQTYAKDFTLKLYGKVTYDGFTPEQILSGWLFYPEDWTKEPMIKIKEESVRKMLGIEGKYAAFSDFFTDNNQYKLADAVNRIYLGEEIESAKEIVAADEKVQLIFMLQMGVPLAIFPLMESGELIWHSPTDRLSDEISENERLLITGYFDLLHGFIATNEIENVEKAFDQLKQFQKKSAGELLPSEQKIKAELIYNQLNISRPIAIMNLLTGIFALLFFFYKNQKSSRSKIIRITLNSLLILSLIGITVMICLRGFISGRVPLGNGAEAMQFLAACILLLTLIFQRRFPFFLSFGFIFSGLVLMVAGIGAANPQITSLQPVLISPLLSIHVSLMMMGYMLFGFITLNSLYTLLIFITSKKEKSESALHILQQSIISKILLYPAIFLAAAGILIGSVWAEVSWGNYWSWDAKEVWALITVIIYAFGLLFDFPQTKRPLAFHLYMLFAFLSVLMTYFGVNYLLGGMHAYN